MTTPDNRRNTQFARNDGGMASTPPSVGHNGTGTLHDGFPVGIGHVGHQHIARLDLVHFRNTVDQTYRAGTNLLADGAAFSQYSALALKFVTQFGRTFGLTLHRFRTSLQDVKQAIRTVLAPLDVHGTSVVFFNDHGVLR